MFVSFPELRLAARLLERGQAKLYASGAGAPTDGVTGAGTAKVGGLYARTGNNTLYVNVRTKANPRWVVCTK